MKKHHIITMTAALLLAGCGRSDKSAAPEYEPVAAQRGDIRVSIIATGTVLPQNRLEIKPPIAGRVESVLVREGEAVKRGQILAWLSSAERAALLDAARARGETELAYWEQLYKPAPLVAPLDGDIIAKNIEPGQAITAQDILFVLCDRLIVETRVDETDIGSIAVGQSAIVTLDAYPGEKMRGKVDHIAYEAKTISNVTSYMIEVLPHAIPAFLRSGMTASVRIITATASDVLMLPIAAVRMDGDAATVLRPGVDAADAPVPATVTTGLSDGKHIEIVSGLDEGDRVLAPQARIPARADGAPARNPFMPARRGAGRR